MNHEKYKSIPIHAGHDAGNACKNDSNDSHPMSFLNDPKTTVWLVAKRTAEGLIKT
jgi:hypothetical protein